MTIPLFDQTTPLAGLRADLHARAAEILDRGVYVLGPHLTAFEDELASYLGAKHVVGVGNGTDALTLALRAMQVGSDDEVVVPSFTFYASAEAIPPTGATPVFCDIDLDTFCVTAETIRPAITPRTKAIIVVDLFGNPAPIDEIKALGIPVLEDAAQAAGTTLTGRAAGTLGDVATFSFYPSKNLGGFGDGGAIVTDEDEIAERVRMLRSHGSRDKVTFERIGYNSRLDELQAGLLRVLLPHLDSWADGRRSAARYYTDAGLGELVGVACPVEGADPAWHLYVVRHARPDSIAEALSAAGIGQKAYYRTPLHRQPAMAPWAQTARLPATEEAARTHLAIPMSPVLDSEQAKQVVGGIRDALSD